MSSSSSAVEDSIPRVSARPAFMKVVRTAAPWALIWLLNALLFVPSFVCSPRSTFFPSPAAVEPAKRQGAWLLDFLLHRTNLDVFRVSFDFGLWVVLAIAVAGTRVSRFVRWFAATYFTVLLIFLAYHHGVSSFLERKPALLTDWRFLLNLAHFLAGVMSPGWAAVCAGVVVALVALPLTAAYALRLVERVALRWPLRVRAGVALGFVVPCAILIASSGIRRDATVVQISAKRVVYNWRNSRDAEALIAELNDPVPDRRYDPYLNVSLKKKPNFYLLMIEAYGEILATWDMDPAYRLLMQRVEGRLKAAGYYARTAYSASPVHGGTSWFAISTVHTGTLIDRWEAYDALELVGARVPSITRFFDAQGYRTYTLAPGTTDHAGLRRFDLFNHDVVVDGTMLDYDGWGYGWGRIPDQWSWMRFRREWFSKPQEPYYVFNMCVSTHWDWGAGVPSYVLDPATLNASRRQPPYEDPNWPKIQEAKRIGSTTRRGYFRSIDYEWRVLLDVLEADKSPDIVVAIVGDHQPRLDADVPGEVTMNTPVHMLSRDEGFVDSLEEYGFQKGMYALPGKGGHLWHEGLFSIWVSKMVERYGEGKVPVYPRGIRMSTLRR